MALINAKCPMCGETNSMQNTECRRCEYRLPWADEVEGIARQSSSSFSARLDKKADGVLETLGITPKIPVTCRFCNHIIERDARRYPHCGESLAAALGFLASDTWQADYEYRKVRKVSLWVPRERRGCMTGLVIALFAFLKDQML